MYQHLVHRSLIGLFSLLMPLCMGSSAHATPVCSQLLMKEDFYIASLADLAKMRLEIDLSVLKGPLAQDLATRLLHEKYPLKYQELVQELSKRFSLTEIKTMIFEKIRQLQSESRVVKEKEIGVRRQERDLIPNPMKLEKSIPIDSNIRAYFDYFPEQGKVFYISEESSAPAVNLKMLDLQSERLVTVVSDVLEAVTMPGARKILVFAPNNTLHIYDVKTGAVKTMEIPPRPSQIWIESISPDGSWVSFGNFEKPFFFNLKTGKVIDNDQVVPSGINTRLALTKLFSGPNTFLIVDKEFIVKVNLKSVSSSKKIKTDQYDLYIPVADGREVLAFADSSAKEAARFSVSNLHKPIEILPLGNFSRSQVEILPSRSKDFILTRGFGQDLRLWRADSLQGLSFVFDRYQEGSERMVSHAALAADLSSAVFMVFKSANEPLHVEKWIRMEEGDVNVPAPHP